MFPRRLGLPRPRAALTLVTLLVLVAACSSSPETSDQSDTPPVANDEVPNPPSDGSPSAADEECVEASIDEAERHTVGSRDGAAWRVEDLLPPPLRTAGLQSGETTILLDEQEVGEVLVEETEPGIFLTTGFTYCVPADVELASIDVVETFGGSWQLVDSTPELDLPDDAEMSLEVREGFFGGWAACNEYSAQPAAGPDGDLRLSGVGFTEAECVDDELVYQELLRTADEWALDDGHLVLSGPQGELRYEPAGSGG